MSDLPEDLSARARRGMLDENEQRRLKALLRASAEGRLLHQAGSQFDAEDSVLPGDDEIAARIVDRTLARTRKAPVGRHGRRRSWLLFAVAACFVAAAATGAATHYRRRLSLRPNAVADLHASDRGSIDPPRARPGAPAPERRDVAEPTEVGERVGASPKPTAATPSRAPSASLGAAIPSPSDLFAGAARARREGSLDEALRLYASLQRRYPDAPESRAADIALGMIQLGRGAASASLEHFQHYLRHSPSGDLVPEAMWGEAEALAKLGRSDEAESRLRALLARFPDSAYTAAARSRLEHPKSVP
jgi:TolA-binding protein